MTIVQQQIATPVGQAAQGVGRGGIDPDIEPQTAAGEHIHGLTGRLDRLRQRCRQAVPDQYSQTQRRFHSNPLRSRHRRFPLARNEIPSVFRRAAQGSLRQDSGSPSVPSQVYVQPKAYSLSPCIGCRAECDSG